MLLIDLADALKEVIDQSYDVMLAKSAKISKISAKTHLHAIIDRFVVRVRTSLGLASWLNEKDSVRRHFFYSVRGDYVIINQNKEYYYAELYVLNFAFFHQVFFEEQKRRELGVEHFAWHLTLERYDASNTV